MRERKRGKETKISFLKMLGTEPTTMNNDVGIHLHGPKRRRRRRRRKLVQVPGKKVGEFFSKCSEVNKANEMKNWCNIQVTTLGLY